jgi:hypothetical protein
MKTKLHLLLAAVLTTSTLLAAAAGQRAGIVTAIRGEVQIQRADTEPVQAVIKTEVREGDVIVTGERGRVQICFEDDSIISVGRKANFAIPKFVYDPSAGKGAMRIEIKEGFFRVLGGAITRIAPENFETVAGTATIGVRGCSFGGEVNGGDATLVFFGSNIGGNIAIMGGGLERLLGVPGNGLSVPRNGPPSAPSNMGRFGMRVLGETGTGPAGPGSGGGTPPPRRSQPPPPPRVPTDPTKALGERLPGILPTSATLHGFAIGSENGEGLALGNVTPDQFSLHLGISELAFTNIREGALTLGVLLPYGSEVPVRVTQTLFLPLLQGEIKDGQFAHVYDPFTLAEFDVTKSSIVAAPGTPAYMNWGKWEMSIVSPDYEARPGSTLAGLWIATDLPQTDLSSLRNATGDLILGGDFRGTYSGEAHCLRNGNEGMHGTSQFAINFRAQTFTGQFDFASSSGPSISYNGGVSSDGTLQGLCTEVTGETVLPTQSPLQGALFDNATVVGASWSALTTENSYVGVAGAQGTIQPAVSVGGD